MEGVRYEFNEEEVGDGSREDMGTGSEGEMEATQGETDDMEGVGNEKLKFIPPLEAEMRMRLLYKEEHSIINLIWYPQLTEAGYLQNPSGHPEHETDGYQIFFVRTILVTPSRFRPPQHLHGESYEHPQNVFLSDILKANYRMMQIGAKEQMAHDLDPSTPKPKDQAVGYTFESALRDWIAMQEAYNSLVDSAKSRNNKNSSGIRQLLEHKEGLFRMNMMGKRVNFAARSVIAPDPYIDTDEVGVPLRFARELCYPEPVTANNVKELRQLVVNGRDMYPGACYIENDKGFFIDLKFKNRGQREALAKMLMTKDNSGNVRMKRVWRNLLEGDILLVNRQPTLHKASIMALRARILKSKRQTIRMHYSNCNTFNADFDGDEINIHFPQGELARSEAYNIVGAKYQYASAKDGSPLRGLIQDHVASGFLLTKRDTFLCRQEYNQLLFTAIAGFGAKERERVVRTLPPTILKPVQLWTGKQVVSSLLINLVGDLPRMNYEGTAQVSDKAWGNGRIAANSPLGEQAVLVEECELLRGVLDKSTFGAKNYSLVHAIHELYGVDLCSLFLSCFGRVVTSYFQKRGFTCSMEDLVLVEDAEKKRRALIDGALEKAVEGLEHYLDLNEENESEKDGEKSSTTPLSLSYRRQRVSDELRRRYINSRGRVGPEIDNVMKSIVSPISSEIFKVCLPHGLYVLFPNNSFSCMIISGAKGSNVNQTQVSCALGQQELEGRRVPMMVSGKTLPSFRPYDPMPRAGGWVSDRFLTGIRPQEYFFHCMAGREGLVDTAVKTSRSGYLQHCIIKHLEDLTVQYDYSVRNSDGTVIQTLYGDDGIDVSKVKYLTGKRAQLDFLSKNSSMLVYKYGLNESFFKDTGLSSERAAVLHAEVRCARRELEASKKLLAEGKEVQFDKSSVVEARRRVGKGEWEIGNLSDQFYPAVITKVHNKNGVSYDVVFKDTKKKERRVPRTIYDNVEGIEVELIRLRLPDPVNWQLNVCRNIGAVNEKYQEALDAYRKQREESGEIEEVESGGLEMLFWMKYMRSLVDPGESVGVIAGQSIGEPSTQMTLNTFHLAGHGAVNVTLGIPRLREVIMTGSRTIATPMMQIPLVPMVPKESAERLMKKLHRISLSELLDPECYFRVVDYLTNVTFGLKYTPYIRKYELHMNLLPADVIKKVYNLNMEDVLDVLRNVFMPALGSLISKDIRKALRSSSLGLDVERVIGGKDLSNMRGVKLKKAEEKQVRGTVDSEDDAEAEEELGEVDGADAGKVRKARIEYEGEESEGETKGNEMEEEKEEGQEREEDAMEEEKDKNDAKQTMGTETSSEKIPEGFTVLEVPFKVMKLKFFRRMLYDAKNNKIRVELELPPSTPKLLLVELAEKAAEETLVNAIKAINKCIVMEKGEKDPGYTLQTEGVNFPTVWLFQHLVDVNRVYSNDIWKILETYGVEAARTAIITEIIRVFDVYSISVDPRHLALIADYMTQDGSYRPMNRGGMENIESPFLQMSFETTTHFLNNAVLYGGSDSMKSPSACISTGKVIKAGTGIFDIVQPLSV